jgi:glutaredoxin
MFVLRLYGLEGCPSCGQAASFIQSKNLPCEMILANNDPIISAGNKALNNGEDKFPILICNLTKDVIVGFKQEEYDRIWKVIDTLFRTGSLDGAGGRQPVSSAIANAPPENPTAAK